MLIEIKCDKFISNGEPRGAISFHKGLNVVLGGADTENSIGKSTFLMIIDFVFGGDDYVNKSIDVQNNVLDHTIQFAFEFDNKRYHFARETTNHVTVWRCDESYNKLEEMRTDAYREVLQGLYNIELYQTTFRDIVGRYFRVYGRDNLDEKKPLHVVKAESAGTAITALVKLFDKYKAISELTLAEKNKREQKNTHQKARKHDFIPSITKAIYKANVKRLLVLQDELDVLQTSVSDKIEHTIYGIDTKDAELLADLRQSLTNAKRNRSRLFSQLRSIENDMGFKNSLNSGNRSDFSVGFDRLTSFFPGVDVRKIEEIEKFHHEMTEVLSSELEDAKKGILSLIELANSEINELEQKIKESGLPTDFTKKMLNSYVEKKNEISKLEKENSARDKMDELNSDAKDLKNKLIQMQEELYSTLQNDINIQMNKFNDYIYDGEKKSPNLNITKPNSYTFYTPDDSGTGTSYKGLIVFDLSILALTDLPAIIHDSVALKQIAKKPIEKIMELYIATPKQKFIAFDGKGDYTDRTQKIIDENTILRLSPGGNELFGRSWNEKKVDIHSDSNDKSSGGTFNE